MKHKTRYGEISKIEAQEDGTLKVWGIASSESEDSDGETITAAAMKAALPDYMRFGAVREMHQPKAAGTALAVEVGDDGVTKICAHIVDSEAIRKVDAGVYKGFSIGGRVTARDELKKTIITGLRLTEISLVDRPANPDAVITCYKADATTTTADDVDGLDKSAWVVARAASLAEDLHSFHNHLQYLTHSEEAPPALVTKLGSMATNLYDALVELAQFEASRGQGMLAAKSAAGDALDKAGRRNNARDQATLNQILTLLKSLGAAEDDDNGDADKRAAADDTPLAKLAAELDVTKASLRQLQEERDDLKQQLAKLAAEPAPAPAVLKTIAKSDDLGGATPAANPVHNGDGSVNDAASLIKMIHAGKAA